jgi:hypothetical protein
MSRAGYPRGDCIIITNMDQKGGRNRSFIYRLDEYPGLAKPVQVVPEKPSLVETRFRQKESRNRHVAFLYLYSVDF